MRSAPDITVTFGFAKVGHYQFPGGGRPWESWWWRILDPAPITAARRAAHVSDYAGAGAKLDAKTAAAEPQGDLWQGAAGSGQRVVPWRGVPELRGRRARRRRPGHRGRATAHLAAGGRAAWPNRPGCRCRCNRSAGGGQPVAEPRRDAEATWPGGLSRQPDPWLRQRGGLHGVRAGLRTGQQQGDAAFCRSTAASPVARDRDRRRRAELHGGAGNWLASRLPGQVRAHAPPSRDGAALPGGGRRGSGAALGSWRGRRRPSGAASSCSKDRTRWWHTRTAGWVCCRSPRRPWPRPAAATCWPAPLAGCWRRGWNRWLPPASGRGCTGRPGLACEQEIGPAGRGGVGPAAPAAGSTA